jgi:hypothetical protein
MPRDRMSACGLVIFPPSLTLISTRQPSCRLDAVACNTSVPSDSPFLANIRPTTNTCCRAFAFQHLSIIVHNFVTERRNQDVIYHPTENHPAKNHAAKIHPMLQITLPPSQWRTRRSNTKPNTGSRLITASLMNGTFEISYLPLRSVLIMP